MQLRGNDRLTRVATFRARVYYILAAQYSTPPSLHHYGLLNRSIELYRTALTFDNQDQMIQSDCLFNLATSLIELADVAEDFHDLNSDLGVIEYKMTSTEGLGLLDEQGIRNTREQVLKILTEVAELQVSCLQPDCGVPENGAEQEVEEQGSHDDMDERPNASTIDGYETHVATPNTLLDVLFLILDVDISILGAIDADKIQTPQDEAYVSSTVLHYWTILDQAKEAERLLNKASGGPANQPVLQCDLRECELIQMLTDMRFMADRATRSVARIESGGFSAHSQSILEAIEAKLVEAKTCWAYTEAPDKDDFRLTVHRAEVDYKSFAARGLKHQQQQVLSAQSTERGLLQQSQWSNLTAGIQSCNTALSIPFSLVNHPLSRGSFLLDLAQFSLRRALLALPDDIASDGTTMIMGEGYPSAIKNVSTLLKNSETHANQSLSSLGWSLYASQTVANGGSSAAGGGTLSIGLLGGPQAAVPPATQGWDHERLCRTTVLTLVRCLWLAQSDPIKHVIAASSRGSFGSTTPNTAAGAPPPGIPGSEAASSVHKAQTLVNKLKASNVHLSKMATGGRTQVVSRADVARYMDEIFHEEGGLRQDERVFWSGFVRELEI